MQLVVFTEEKSMEITLRAVLPRLSLRPDQFQIVTHEGVGDLEASLARKLRKWRDPNARFLIIRDNDRGDCRARKARLAALAEASGSRQPRKIRIVMQELEAWFLGDPAALEAAGLLDRGQRPAALREPETNAHPEGALRQLDRSYQKGIGARRIAPHLDPSRNEAGSFHATIAAIRELAELGEAHP